MRCTTVRGQGVGGAVQRAPLQGGRGRLVHTTQHLPHTATSHTHILYPNCRILQDALGKEVPFLSAASIGARGFLVESVGKHNFVYPLPATCDLPPLQTLLNASPASGTGAAVGGSGNGGNGPSLRVGAWLMEFGLAKALRLSVLRALACAVAGMMW